MEGSGTPMLAHPGACAAQYAIALGSNVGDRLEHLRGARSKLLGLGTLLSQSSVYETAAVGPPQDDYLNAVVVLESAQPPDDLMRELLRIESEQGRVRLERWGPRTLDLDIIVMRGAFGTRHSSDVVDIPHPRFSERPFVLAPLREVWPNLSFVTPENPCQVVKEVGSSEALRRLSFLW